MRSWITLLNDDPGVARCALEAAEALFAAVRIDLARGGVMRRGLLLQVDYDPAVPTDGTGLRLRSPAPPVLYSGWLRDAEAGGLYSALRDDLPPRTILTRPLIGEFSCAVLWDLEAVYATDHYATHPVYYRFDRPGCGVVSNDLRLLLACGGGVPEINEEACRDYLSFDCLVGENELDAGRTFFRGVRKLLPGQQLKVALPALTHKTRAGMAGAPVEPDPVPDASPGAMAEHFRRVLNACVRDRMQAGVGGVLLSGGIDSGAILGACLAVAPEAPPFALSLCFGDPDLAMSQDVHLLTALFEACTLPHRLIRADALLYLPTTDDPCTHVDGPDPAANPLAREACAALLAERRVAGVMTGEGGDIVLGESTHEWIVDALCAREGLAALHRFLSGNLGARTGSVRYLRLLLRALVPAYGRAALEREFAPAATRLPAFLTPALQDARRVRLAPPWRGWLAHGHMRRMLHPRAAYFDAMNLYCLHSHPYLDPRMQAFALSCPPQALHDYRHLEADNPYRTAKQLAREAYRRELPDFLCDKAGKTSYAMMARRMIQNSAARLYGLTERPMLLHERGWVDQALFRRHLLAYLIATEDPNADLGLRHHFMRGVADLEVWLRRFSAPPRQVLDQLRVRLLRPPPAG